MVLRPQDIGRLTEKERTDIRKLEAIIDAELSISEMNSNKKVSIVVMGYSNKVLQSIVKKYKAGGWREVSWTSTQKGVRIDFHG